MASGNGVLVGSVLLSNLSPLQQKIVSELAASPLTLSELSEKTGSSIYTLGKQLSLMQLRTKYNPLHGKGVEKPLVRKEKDPGQKTLYSLTDSAKQLVE